MSHRTVSVTVDARLLEFYERIVQERGVASVKLAIVEHMRESVREYFREVEREQDPESRYLKKLMSDFVESIPSGTLKAVARTQGLLQWPLAEDGRALSFEEATAAAVKRGKAAAKRAKTSRVAMGNGIRNRQIEAFAKSEKLQEVSA